MRVGIQASVAVVLSGMALATAGPALANAGNNGVHVDPGSPAGKQYAIPIPSARSETSGQQGGSGSSNPPLFGVGVTPAGAAATGASPATTSGSPSRAKLPHGVTRSAAHRRTPNHGATRSAPSTTAQNVSRAAEKNAVGGTSWLPLLIGGVLVLVIGGGGGFFLRRSL